MDVMVQFLRERLNEDERTALAATQGDWVWSREFVTPPGYHHRTIGPLEPGDAVHISRQNPARVLAEVESKRALLDAVVSAKHDHAYWTNRPGPTADPDVRAKMDARWSAWSFVLSQLARPYVDHPDYPEGWRP